jgi:hypothetical protein
MNDSILPTSFTPFPPGYCFQSYNQFGADIARNLLVVLPGTITPWNIGPNQPVASLRDRPWLVTDAETGAPVQGMGGAAWAPAYGKWVVEYPVPASGFERRLWIGTLNDLETYDGGSVGTVSDTTGPFWEQDTNFDDKGIIGVGGTRTPVNTDFNVFDDATPGLPALRTVYIIKRTLRIYRTYS